MDFSVVIMAGGKGTRMKSELPKPLHQLAGRPMLHWVIEAAYQSGASQVITVVRADNQVREYAQDTEVVEQIEQQGTGAAVLSVVGRVKNPGVVVLSGDNPLITSELIKDLAGSLNSGVAAAILVTKTLPPEGYGRIVRQAGEIKAIVETKYPDEVDAAILSIKEINVGVYAFKTELLFEELKKAPVEQNGEMYLTSVISQLLKAGEQVTSIETHDSMVGVGVNTPEELKALAAAFLERQDLNRK